MGNNKINNNVIKTEPKTFHFDLPNDAECLIVT